LVAALAFAFVPALAFADILTDGQEPPRGHVLVEGPSSFGVSFVLRLPSGPGLDLSLHPFKRLELGAEVSSWLAISEAGVYARYAVLSADGASLTLGGRFHGIATLGPEDESQRRFNFLSIE
jgi:hypothetical protein